MALLAQPPLASPAAVPATRGIHSTETAAAGRAVEPRSGSLGKHEELSTVGCTCGPDHLRLRSNFGELVPVRGGCVNRCEYCATLAAVENCEMLVLDALEGDAPQIVCILGTRTPTLDMARFARAREFMIRAVRRRWPAAEYAYEVEFTTGYGPRSGGLRRPHWNWFWKGIDRAHADELRELVVRVWCQHVDALPDAQYVAEIDNAVGLTKYVTEHFMKASQRPPAGFTGQRFCASRGYFRGSTVTAARKRAKESLQRKRAIWRATTAGYGSHDAELIAHEELVRAAQTVWVVTSPTGARLSPVMVTERRMVLSRELRTERDPASSTRSPQPPPP